jgi:hypothetical protein
MIKLCSVSDWIEHTAEKGRGKGNVFKTRISIAADLWNWIVGMEYEGKEALLDTHYYPNFKLLLPRVVAIFPQVKLNVLAFNVIKELQLKTKKTISITGTETLAELGQKIDNTFLTNRFIEDGVTKKIFGVEEAETE